ncbi:response regulator transcription factor [Micromonospora sp. DR5-3]|uniref:response regulator n=1 Tax=unclassified Micromonospora TaxID=2617518 RepID=UPI0011D7160A|nr:MULTISPECIES: response regulator transcription factor [unclassified Micromonospora]MCW3816348.1 response regulator transcription factor [Micromonospora sp. DR5-3]TYC22774.1 response regulator transcription factor [Micromonospora sp. MP36]
MTRAPRPADPIRVLIVDDHPIVRRGLRAALDADPGITVVGEAATGADAIAQAEAATPDVVLMDLHLGAGINGAEATRRILAHPRPPRVLVLTTYDSDADILPAITAGATGYLLKDTEPDDLLAAIRSAAAGETVLAPAIASRLVTRVRTPGRALTPREIQILQLVAEGHSNHGIARAMFITEATVKSHLVQVFSKLDVDNRTAAVAEGRRRGVIR